MSVVRAPPAQSLADMPGRDRGLYRELRPERTAAGMKERAVTAAHGSERSDVVDVQHLRRHNV